MVMVRVGSPWASGGFYGAVGSGVNGSAAGYYAPVVGMNAVVNGAAAAAAGYGGGGGYGLVNGVNGVAGPRMPVAMAVPGRRGGDIWW